MEVKWHVLFGFVISYLLISFDFVSLIGGIIIFLSSVLIDIDHYTYYVYKKKDWNLKKAVKWYYFLGDYFNGKSKKVKDSFESHYLAFHSLMFLIILFLLGNFVNIFFMWVFIGFSIHLILDLLVIEYWKREKWYLKIFPCLIIYKNRKKKSLSSI